MMSQLAAGGVGLLLALSVLGIVARRALGSRLLYAACFAVCAGLAGVALRTLLAPGGGFEMLAIPLGLPLRSTLLGLDPLSAAFAVIVNLAAAIVSAYAIGYAAHAREPQRVLPFYPAFIAGMNLVLLAQERFPSWSAGSSCRSPPGRWCSVSTAPPRTAAPRWFISSWHQAVP